MLLFILHRILWGALELLVEAFLSAMGTCLALRAFLTHLFRANNVIFLLVTKLVRGKSGNIIYRDGLPLLKVLTIMQPDQTWAIPCKIAHC
jgi:hypothetical protein